MLKITKVPIEIRDRYPGHSANPCLYRALAVLGVNFDTTTMTRKGRKHSNFNDLFEWLNWQCGLQKADMPNHRCNLRQLASFHMRELRTGKWLICTNGHAFAMIDGTIYDWGDPLRKVPHTIYRIPSDDAEALAARQRAALAKLLFQ